MSRPPADALSFVRKRDAARSAASRAAHERRIQTRSGGNSRAWRQDRWGALYRSTVATTSIFVTSPVTLSVVDRNSAICPSRRMSELLAFSDWMMGSPPSLPATTDESLTLSTTQKRPFDCEYAVQLIV